MKKYRKHILTAGIVLMICLVNPLSTIAQPTDPGCDPLDPACPIDGGLSLLIAAGIGIGAKKAYNQKKRRTHQI